ncbi:hypothetical protein [Paenibacillus glycanilyticus]|uniref:hypothetical protein n=1 Tax=Paenibacillus glycanilyticus TaxID=126569 RepID=UPI0037CB54DD
MAKPTPYYHRIVTSYVDEQGRRKHRTEKYLGALSEEEADRIRRELRIRNSPVLPAPRESFAGETYLFQSVHRLAYAPGSPASLEKVLSLKPDLILINDTLSENYDGLSKIAPTLFIP